MNIYIDNIIFSLQNHGGISVVWNELLKRMLVDPDLNVYFLEQKKMNSIGKRLNIKPNQIINNNLANFPVSIQRYLSPKIDAKNGIFHSTYLRTCTNKSINNVTTIHDFTYEYFSKGLAKQIHHIQKKHAIKYSKKIICVSQNTKMDLLRYFPNIDEKNVHVVYNGVSNDYYKLNENKNLKMLIPFKDQEYVLYVGDRRGIYKNFNLVVESCRISNTPLVIVGGGVLTDAELYFLNTTLGKSNYTILLNVSNSTLNQLYNSASFLIYPSLYEGFGIPIIEAQKAQCSVICSNHSSIPEVAGNGAFIVENISAQSVADIIAQSKSRPIGKEEKIKSGIENAERFSWDICYRNTKEIYKNLF